MHEIIEIAAKTNSGQASAVAICESARTSAVRLITGTEIQAVSGHGYNRRHHEIAGRRRPPISSVTRVLYCLPVQARAKQVSDRREQPA
jgi:hypothetical protein